MFPDGATVPSLGQGTWKMGEVPSRRQQEIASLRTGVERGLTVIDTAEMYGEGKTELLVGEALHGLRERVYLVSKVYPHNAGKVALEAACDRSLKRLRTDRLDLYLLHWRGSVPLQETVDGMETLKQAGKIRAWGVSNFDVTDMQELERCGGDCASNQVLYNLTRRGPEYDLLPWMTARSMLLMAYSPLEQGRIPRNATLQTIAETHGVKPAQIALAWVLRRAGVLAIPKASSLAHLEENLAAAALTLTEKDMVDLDKAFPAPKRKVPLEML